MTKDQKEEGVIQHDSNIIMISEVDVGNEVHVPTRTPASLPVPLPIAAEEEDDLRTMEAAKNAIIQERDQLVQNVVQVPHLTSTATKAAGVTDARTDHNQSKTTSASMDDVVSKLDDILERLDRIEATISTFATAPKHHKTNGTATSNNATPHGNKSTKSSSSGSRVKQSVPWAHTSNNNPRTQTQQQEEASSTNGHTHTNDINTNLHFYDNEYHVLPQDWTLPRLTFEGLFVYWFLGDPSIGIPPFVKISGTEFKNIQRGVRKRSDMKYLMKHVERKGREENVYVDDLKDWNVDNVKVLYDRTSKYFDYPHKTSSAQTKFEKLSWETICHNVRRNKGILVGEKPPSPSTIVTIYDSGEAIAEGNVTETTNATNIASGKHMESTTCMDPIPVPLAAANPVVGDDDEHQESMVDVTNEVEMTDVSALPEQMEDGGTDEQAASV